MGTPVIHQRRGKGSSTFRAPSHRYLVDLKHRSIDEKEEKETVKGKVVDIVHDPARTAPVLKVEFEDGEKKYVLAMEGVKVGDELSYGASSTLMQGNTLPLGSIPEGTPIHNIENRVGDGGKFIRSSGAYGLLISHDGRQSVVQMPSGGLKTINSRCRATIGIVAGGGRRDKPILKAGKAYHAQKPKAKYWPIVRKVRMNPVDHPHGGGSGSPGKPTSMKRGTPPGRNVGLIAPRRTGKK
ncbi:MAG: 50S ribosomal protein L2 [Candidatus Hydrothermarchaeales archaeon]